MLKKGNQIYFMYWFGVVNIGNRFLKFILTIVSFKIHVNASKCYFIIEVRSKLRI